MACDRPNNQRYKKFHLARYPYCNNCNHKVVHANCILDHIIRLTDGGPDTIDNTQLLCTACDYLKTAAEDCGDRIRQLEQKIASEQGRRDNLGDVMRDNYSKKKQDRRSYKKYQKELSAFV